MTDEAPLRHPADFRRLCEHAVERFRALAAATPHDRGELVAELGALLVRIDEQVDDMDLLEPGFAREQGFLADASSALQSIGMDRGGPHVERYVQRAIADLQRVEGDAE